MGATFAANRRKLSQYKAHSCKSLVAFQLVSLSFQSGRHNIALFCSFDFVVGIKPSLLKDNLSTDKQMER